MFIENGADIPPISSNIKQEKTYASFKPGYLNQDIFTLPLEGALIGSLNYFYNPRSKTLFPLEDEATSESMQATTYGRSMLLPYAIGTGALVFLGLTLSNDDFHMWTQARGFMHAILLSEVANTAAKVTFQRKRPTYDAQINGNHGEDTPDSRASFYSDHANQAFVFASYTSLMMFKFSPSLASSCVYSAAVFTAASVISYSRVENHAHNFTDIITGALVGTTISSLVFFRVQNVEAHENQKQGSQYSTNWNITPGLFHDDTGKTWYTADIKLEI